MEQLYILQNKKSIDLVTETELLESEDGYNAYLITNKQEDDILNILVNRMRKKGFLYRMKFLLRIL